MTTEIHQEQERFLDAWFHEVRQNAPSVAHDLRASAADPTCSSSPSSQKRWCNRMAPPEVYRLSDPLRHNIISATLLRALVHLHLRTYLLEPDGNLLEPSVPLPPVWLNALCVLCVLCILCVLCVLSVFSVFSLSLSISLCVFVVLFLFLKQRVRETDKKRQNR